MSLHVNRATVCLMNMIRKMSEKGIENARVIKIAALLLETGVSPTCISPEIRQYSLAKQRDDGGYIGNSDTMFNAVFLNHYPEYREQAQRALDWIVGQANEDGAWGRTSRDISRIPATGLLLYFRPQLATKRALAWLENEWGNEQKSLTYKAAYTLAAFKSSSYTPQSDSIIPDTIGWLASQQEDNGGYAPWHGHPQGPDIICTSIAMLGLLAFGREKYGENIAKAYDFMCSTQMDSGIWPLHEIDDATSWGVYALTKAEEYLENPVR